MRVSRAPIAFLRGPSTCRSLRAGCSVRMNKVWFNRAMQETPVADTPALDTHAGDAFVAAAERALASGDLNGVSNEDLTRVMTAAVRLYAAKTDTNYESFEPVEPQKMTPTDIVVTVTAMIRAVGLNLWDLSMWVQRPQR